MGDYFAILNQMHNNYHTARYDNLIYLKMNYQSL